MEKTKSQLSFCDCSEPGKEVSLQKTSVRSKIRKSAASEQLKVGVGLQGSDNPSLLEESRG